MDWRDRFRAGVVRAAGRASRRPDRGVIVADHGGNDEAYAWDVETGALRKVSDSGTAVLEAAIRPDGASIVYHRDTTGSEFGHLHEAPFDGGAKTDLTPDLPEYATYALQVADDVVVAAMAAGDDQSLLIVRPGSTAVVPMPAVVMDLKLAPDGSTVAVAEAMDGLYGRTVLRATTDGSEIDRLDYSWPGRIQGGRVAVAVHRDGWLRPAIWTRDAASTPSTSTCPETCGQWTGAAMAAGSSCPYGIARLRRWRHTTCIPGRCRHLSPRGVRRPSGSRLSSTGTLRRPSGATRNVRGACGKSTTRTPAAC
jgi:hypothetical protein